IDHKQAKKIAVPDLSKASGAELVKALEHLNRAVRMTAQRLLIEQRQPAAIALLKDGFAKAGEWAQIHRLWVLQQLSDLPPTTLTAALGSEHAAVRKNALQVAAVSGGESAKSAITARLNDSDPRTRLEAVNALAALPVDKASSDALVAVYPSFNDPWLESAAVGALSKNPTEGIASALNGRAPESYRTLVTLLVATIAQKNDADAAAALVTVASQAPATADALKIAVFESLARALKPEIIPALSADLRTALGAALKSPNFALASAALPLVARWDKAGSLGPDAKTVLQSLMAKLSEGASEAERSQAATVLLSAHQLDPKIVPTVMKLLGSSAPISVQTEIVQGLGAIPDVAVGTALVAVFPRLAPAVHDAAFTQIARRAEWSSALLDAVKEGRTTLAQLGPPAVHRLRTHPDADVAAKASAIIDELRGPEAKEKNGLIAKLTPEVEKPGTVVKGKELFTQNCAVCHSFNGEGKSVGPDLTG
ncbi:MAG TPA: HEAT repeat domain-containing protein, partial [Burkholderiales bacterium]|nr:HEAT repeat domain-containing protein [Burkholderiales bacterium]